MGAIRAEEHEKQSVQEDESRLRPHSERPVHFSLFTWSPLMQIAPDIPRQAAACAA